VTLVKEFRPSDNCLAFVDKLGPGWHDLPPQISHRPAGAGMNGFQKERRSMAVDPAILFCASCAVEEAG
jgi:hypothetical protein